MHVPALTLHNVTKTYGGNVGVNNLQLEVQQGTIFGFLGPNGAGKTTTIRMVLDFIRPTSGNIQVLGLDSQRDSLTIRKRVGYLAGDIALDNRLNGQQYLELIAHLRGGIPWSTIHGLTDRLQCELDKKIGKLSRGNKQKLGLIAALMHDPDLLILDEPTSGLDPLMQAEFNKLIRERAQRGKTAFISSHVLSEVQAICDHVGFIRAGTLMDVQPLQHLTKQAFKKVRLALSRPRSTALKGVTGIQDLQIDGTTITCKITGNYKTVLQAIAKLPVKDIAIEEPDLDDLFMHYYTGETT